jgi:nicotinate-nucleotide pyrophosphorylase (carboxylating)
MIQQTIDEIIIKALEEDIRYGDLTTSIMIDATRQAQGILICKEDSVIAGIDIARRVFTMVDDSIQWESLCHDGQCCKAFEKLATVRGKARSLLTAERTALNFLQHLSGIATKTKRYADIAQHYSVKITDTRKTLPGLRYLQKYAVTMGGGLNHRIALDDGILIKNNHLKFFKTISDALKQAQSQKPYLTEIEIEVSSLKQLQEALTLKPSVIMLDNFSITQLQQALYMAKGICRIEISGGVDESNLEQIAALQPDYISIGSLTHSVRAVDIHLVIEAL